MISPLALVSKAYGPTLRISWLIASVILINCLQLYMVLFVRCTDKCTF
jgi:hypothetical protein